MKMIRVQQSPPLNGEVLIGTSKNSMLPILAGCLLSKKEIILHDVPELTDVRQMCQLLQSLGAQVIEKERTWAICCSNIRSCIAPVDIVQRFRASFLIAGPLLARFGSVVIPFPGGCSIGSRPVDMHIKGLNVLGAKAKDQGFALNIDSARLKGDVIYLDYPSVGATENIMMAAVLAQGVTSIINAAREPEIEDLARFLNIMGARIQGAGGGMITIEGVKELDGCEYRAIPDRIEAGTFMYATAVAGGDIALRNASGIWLKPVFAKLREAGAQVWEEENLVRVQSEGTLEAVHIKTMPWPGFPTDLQPQAMVLSAVSRGTSLITETVFENRFLHVNELLKMGADISIQGRCAVVQGCRALWGARVQATDLRAGAALVLAGLTAQGETDVMGIEHIERGYENLPYKLNALGADIKIIDTHIDNRNEYPMLY